jgi:ABC-2 type transport system permease protein
VSVTVLIAFPILIIFVLGNALGSFISPDYNFGEDRIAVAVVAEQDSRISEFMQSDEVTRFLGITFTDEKNALEMLENNEVFIIITDNNGELVITRPPVGMSNTQIAMAIIDSFVQINAAMQTSMTNGADFTELMQILEANVSVTNAPLGNRVPDAIDYYAVTMLVMILMFAGTNGMELFGKGLFSDTGARTLTTPVSKPVLIGGLLAAATVTTFLQGMVTFLFSWLVYGVYWGDRIGLILLALFGITLFSQAFAIFLILLCKSPNMAMGLMQGGIWVMTFVSGGYVKMSFGAADEIFQYAPNALAHTVIFGAAFGGNESKMMADLALIFIYSTVLFILAFLLGRRILKT